MACDQWREVEEAVDDARVEWEEHLLRVFLFYQLHPAEYGSSRVVDFSKFGVVFRKRERETLLQFAEREEYFRRRQLRAGKSRRNDQDSAGEG